MGWDTSRLDAPRVRPRGIPRSRFRRVPDQGRWGGSVPAFAGGLPGHRRRTCDRADRQSNRADGSGVRSRRVARRWRGVFRIDYRARGDECGPRCSASVARGGSSTRGSVGWNRGAANARGCARLEQRRPSAEPASLGTAHTRRGCRGRLRRPRRRSRPTDRRSAGCLSSSQSGCRASPHGALAASRSAVDTERSGFALRGRRAACRCIGRAGSTGVLRPPLRGHRAFDPPASRWSARLGDDVASSPGPRATAREPADAR
jgi:hypothetical protein